MDSSAFPIFLASILHRLVIFPYHVLKSSLCQCLEFLDCSSSCSMYSMLSLSISIWSISFISIRLGSLHIDGCILLHHVGTFPVLEVCYIYLHLFQSVWLGYCIEPGLVVLIWYVSLSCLFHPSFVWDLDQGRWLQC